MVSEWVSLCSKLANTDAHILTFKFLCNYSKAICAGNGSCQKHSSEALKTQNSQKLVRSSKSTQRPFVLMYLDFNYNADMSQNQTLHFSFSNLFFYNTGRILIVKTSFFRLLLATAINVILAIGKTSMRLKQLHCYLKCNSCYRHENTTEKKLSCQVGSTRSKIHTEMHYILGSSSVKRNY